MNSYIDINRNASFRRERAKRGAYALTEAGASFVCTILNFISFISYLLSSDAVRLVLRGACVCVSVLVLIGSVGAMESGSITLFDCFIRVALCALVSLGVFRLVSED